MTSVDETSPGPGAGVGGTHERHIARSTLAQQGSQAFGVVAMLIVITLLARTLSLDEFGLYGLLIALASYLLVLQASIEGATVRAIAMTTSQAERDRVFSTALALYAAFGLLAGVVIAAVGIALVGVFDIAPDLRSQAREGLLVLGLVTAVGWPFRAFQDALRGSQRFVAASIAEIAANTAFVVAMVALIVGGAPLWAVVACGGSLPILLGLGSGVVLIATRAPFRFRGREVDVATGRSLLAFSAYLSAIGIADLIIYSLDRVILAAFRPTSTVGLYEGAARPHALVRQLHSTLVVTVVPVAAGFLATRDDERLHDLLLRGTRYVMAVVVPVVVVLMVLSAPLLDAWLGPEFRVAGTAMAILISYWLINAGTGVAGAMLVAAGRAAELTRYAWLVAVCNLTLSLALTPWLGLEGLVIGTALPYFLLFGVFLRLVLAEFPVSVGRLVREAFLPAYLTGAVVAAVLGALRLLAPPEGLLAVAAAGAAGAMLGWGLFYACWLDAGERNLIRNLLRRTPAT